MAEIVQDPQLRYTSDNQTAVAEMLVQFEGLRPEDAPETLKVIAWRNLAQEVQERYHQGDRIVIEGRLSMNTMDRPEGFKEKRAELTAQKIHLVSSGTGLGDASSSASFSDGTSPAPYSPPQSRPSAAPRASSEPAPAAYSTPVSAAPDYADYDDIPF